MTAGVLASATVVVDVTSLARPPDKLRTTKTTQPLVSVTKNASLLATVVSTTVLHAEVI